MPPLLVAMPIPVGTKKPAKAGYGSKNESERRDLNPRPPLPQSGALPSCATPRSTRSYHAAALSATAFQPLQQFAVQALSSHPRIAP